MKLIIDTLEHTATGAPADGKVSALARIDDSGVVVGSFASPIRHIHITGIEGSTVVKIECSIDDSPGGPAADSWKDWKTDIDADDWYIVPDGPLYLRTNCTTYDEGTVTVKVQKFVES